MRDLKAAGVVKSPHEGALPPMPASVGAGATSYSPSGCYVSSFPYACFECKI